jgi:hypothetical protein
MRPRFKKVGGIMIVVHARAILLYLPCREYGNSAVIFDIHGD